MPPRKPPLAPACSGYGVSRHGKAIGYHEARRSIAVGINNGELTLGRFQSIIFAEFGGPRKREISIQVIAE